MTEKLSQEELVLASQLRGAGIPLDAEVLKTTEAACRGLAIYPGPNIPDSRILDLDFGGTGYMITVAFHNNSPRILWLHECRLETPWWEPCFRWLEDPLGKIPREYTYDFPDPGPIAFDRDIVLNHHLGGKCRLCPGDWIEGLLLGVGQEPMPSHYLDRRALEMRVWVIDEKGNRFGADIRFLVDREARLARERKLLKRHERSWAQGRSRLVSAGFGVPGGHPTT
jgi:hypothetical protein